MRLQALLGMAVSPNRYRDDADVVEAALVRSLDRWGDRRFGEHGHFWDRDSVLRTDPAMPEQADETLSAYEAELAVIDRRLQSRGSQNHD